MSQVVPTFTSAKIGKTDIFASWLVNGDTPKGFRIYTDPFNLSRSKLVDTSVTGYQWTGLPEGTLMNLSVACVYGDEEFANSISVRTEGTPNSKPPDSPVPRQPPPPPPPTGGYIADRWHTLGGPQGSLGQPTSNEETIPGRAGRRQRFAKGEILWCPDQGPKMMLAVWVQPGTKSVTADWGPTTPFNYSFFIVRWDEFKNQHNGQHDVTGGARERGRYTINFQTAGTYDIYVEGCDGHTFTSSDCNQSWTPKATISLG